MSRFTTIGRAAGLMTLVVLVVAPFGAEGHPVRECGDYGGGRGYGPVDGAGIYNVTTRLVSCETALRIVKRHYYVGSRLRCNTAGTRCRSRVGTFTCRSRQTGYEEADTRCISARSKHYVVRWQSGA